MGESTEAKPQPEPVGSCATDESPYGVRDMAGGVSDWTADSFGDRSELKVVKGGHWAYGQTLCRAAARDRFEPAFTHPNLGFRIVVRPGGRADR